MLVQEDQDPDVPEEFMIDPEGRDLASLRLTCPRLNHGPIPKTDGADSFG